MVILLTYVEIYYFHEITIITADSILNSQINSNSHIVLIDCRQFYTPVRSTTGIVGR